MADIKIIDIINFLEYTSEDDALLSQWRDALEDADVMSAMAEEFGTSDDDEVLEDKVNYVHDLIVSILKVGDCPAHEFYRFVTPLLAD